MGLSVDQSSAEALYTHVGLNVALPVDGYVKLGFQSALWFLKLFWGNNTQLAGWLRYFMRK